MRNAKFKGKSVKQHLSKCDDVCKTYEPLQTAYAKLLQENEDIVSFRCNVQLEGTGDVKYTSDFVCTKKNGDLMVRECIYRAKLDKPRSIGMLDISRDYWTSHGVIDWGLVIDAAEE